MFPARSVTNASMTSIQHTAPPMRTILHIDDVSYHKCPLISRANSRKEQQGHLGGPISPPSHLNLFPQLTSNLCHMRHWLQVFSTPPWLRSIRYGSCLAHF